MKFRILLASELIRSRMKYWLRRPIRLGVMLSMLPHESNRVRFAATKVSSRYHSCWTFAIAHGRKIRERGSWEASQSGVNLVLTEAEFGSEVFNNTSRSKGGGIINLLRS